MLPSKDISYLKDLRLVINNTDITATGMCFTIYVVAVLLSEAHTDQHFGSLYLNVIISISIID